MFSLQLGNWPSEAAFEISFFVSEIKKEKRKTQEKGSQSECAGNFLRVKITLLKGYFQGNSTVH